MEQNSASCVTAVHSSSEQTGGLMQVGKKRSVQGVVCHAMALF